MLLKVVEFPKVASLTSPDALNERLADLGLNIRADRQLRFGPDTPLAQPIRLAGVTLANRWCIHPMEGADATLDGRPTNWTRRRWRHFGQSGAKLIWGGEAVAVRPDGRSNPRQLLINERNVRALRALRELLVDEHCKAFGQSGLIVGLQLIHAGRFAAPGSCDHPEPKILYRHPILDRTGNIPPDHPVVTDDWIEELIEAFIAAAQMAADAGFDLVDIQHCHGHLGHEFLSAHTRPGPFGGSFENRTRFLRRVVEGIRRKLPKLIIGVRVSAYDTVPYEGGPHRVGRPVDFRSLLPYRWGFGVDAANPLLIDLAEPRKFVRLCRDLGAAAVSVSAGSPYYSPHIHRPAAFASCDGYRPPEDPLLGAGRLLDVAADLKAHSQDSPAEAQMLFVGAGYSYFQEYLAHVAQWMIARGRIDMVGIGRMALCYWQMPTDLLAGRPIQPGRICRTFSDCVTSARRGFISGCFPLDPAYHLSQPGKDLRAMKRRDRDGRKPS